MKKLLFIPLILLLCLLFEAEPSFAIESVKSWQTQEYKLKDEEIGYEITCTFPKFSEKLGENISVLNEKIEQLVKERVNEHKSKFSKRESDSKNSSYLNLKCSVFNPLDHIISVLFKVESYSAGAAHPNHWSQSINFNRKNARFLKLSDVLNNGSNYLVTVSKLCVQDLSKKKGLDEAWIKTGAGPKPINYLCFYLEKDAIKIVFDEYKVGPYSAGSQLVSIPYSKVKSLINPSLEIKP